MNLKYTYLACGPSVKCKCCGETEWSQVKQSSDEGINFVPYALRRTEPIPASWSLHCGGACSKKAMTTTFFEKLDNPIFRNLSNKNRARYDYNRKRVVAWLSAGWPETNARIEQSSLLHVATGSIKEFAQLVLEVVGQNPRRLGDLDVPTTDAVKAAHIKHLACLRRQFPELPHTL